jgi:PAS domain S-box-containing protein
MGEHQTPEKLFRSLLEGVDLLAFCLDREKRVTFCNDYLLSLTGYGREEVIGKDWFETFCPADVRDDLASRCAQYVEQGHLPRKVLTEIMTASGERRQINCYGTLLYDESGQCVGTASIAEDVTDRLFMQRDLMASQKKLSELSAELSLAEQRERRRLATELHDHISQNMAFAKMKLGALAKSGLSEVQSALLRSVSESMDEAIKMSRSLIMQLSPPVLYEVGFEAAVATFCEQFGAEHAVEIDLQDDGRQKPLAEPVKVTLFQLVRELLINVAKHARAKRVKIIIVREDGMIRIAVRDDGVGFDMTALNLAAEKSGFGLFNVRQRIELLGGDFTMYSEPGGGTEVVFRAPLAPANERETS